MKRVARIAVLLGCFLAATTCPTWSQDDNQRASLLLIMPPRPRIVQLAFDFAGLRAVNLLTYQSDPRTGKIGLHVWRGQGWVEVGVGDYDAGIRGIAAREVIVIGSEQDVPVAIAGQPSWCVAMRRAALTDLGTIMNTVAGVLALKPGEWKWIARRYNLELEDLNAERRRQGKYGRPPPPRVEKQELPPEKIELPPEDLAPAKITPPSAPPREPAPALLPEDK